VPADSGDRVQEKPAPLTGNNTAAQVRRAQEAWAKYLGRQVEEEDEIAPGVTMKFVLIPPGTFWMGSPKDEKDRDEDEVQHEVVLTKPFYLGKYEVMQAQYEALVGKEKNQSKFKGPNLPMETVSWEEADSFAKEWTKKASGKCLYRLPTEAEWEYACRGGANVKESLPFHLKNGPTSSLSGGQINFECNYPYGAGSKGKWLERTAPCGSFTESVNVFGLYDMHGNVWEWCGDWYGEYPRGRVTDPTGPQGGSERVIRGGSWYTYGRGCTAANRGHYVRSFRQDSGQGLRLARIPSGMVK
jgi:formylglycine-generating enzyme required for sulfatase activity